MNIRVLAPPPGLYHCAMDDARLQVDTPLASLDPTQWDRLTGSHPALSHAYFSALHDTGCASSRSSWTPFFLTLRRGGKLAGAMPLHLKTHSRGEYVFDHTWTQAFERRPALLPQAPGGRALHPGHRTAPTGRRAAARVALARGLVELPRRPSSSRCTSSLRPGRISRPCARQAPGREGVQFHWRNAGYADFEAFLTGFNNDKRKKLRQDRRKIQVQDLRFRHFRGREIGPPNWPFLFYACYRNTYLQLQAIEYCIGEGLARFKGGAQGEHKTAATSPSPASFSLLRIWACRACNTSLRWPSGPRACLP